MRYQETIFSFSLTAGPLVRQEELLQLQKEATKLGLRFSANDDGGWLLREYAITVEGDDAAVKSYASYVKRRAKE